jgi:hypothetical protein
MKDANIKKAWIEFTNNKYKQYFLTNNEEWFNNLKDVEDYLNINNKRPSTIDKDNEIKRLAKWIGHQQDNYSSNEQIMKDNTIKNTWLDFTTKYKQYFLSKNEIWLNKLKRVEDYIIKNNKRPSNCDKDIEIKELGSWIGTQRQNYIKNTEMMKDETIKKIWFDFTNNKYKQYFLSNNEVWFNNLKDVEEYIVKNNKRPSQHDKDSKIKKLGRWFSCQQQNYLKNEQIMKEDNIKKTWVDFKNKYSKLF